MLVRKGRKEQCELLWERWINLEFMENTMNVLQTPKLELLSVLIVLLEVKPGCQIDSSTAMYIALLFINS